MQGGKKVKPFKKCDHTYQYVFIFQTTRFLLCLLKCVSSTVSVRHLCFIWPTGYFPKKIEILKQREKNVRVNPILYIAPNHSNTHLMVLYI